MERKKLIIEPRQRVRLLDLNSPAVPVQAELELVPSAQVELTEWMSIAKQLPPCSGWWDFLTVGDKSHVRLWYDLGHIYSGVKDDGSLQPGAFDHGPVLLFGTMLLWRGLAKPWDAVVPIRRRVALL